MKKKLITLLLFAKSILLPNWTIFRKKKIKEILIIRISMSKPEKIT